MLGGIVVAVAVMVVSYPPIAAADETRNARLAWLFGGIVSVVAGVCVSQAGSPLSAYLTGRSSPFTRLTAT